VGEADTNNYKVRAVSHCRPAQSVGGMGQGAAGHLKETEDSFLESAKG
jgi:hypothetical protein